MTVIANLNKCLEPEAVALTGGSIADQSALYSVAISLKRIADALDSETGYHLSIRDALSRAALKHGIPSQ